MVAPNLQDPGIKGFTIVCHSMKFFRATSVAIASVIGFPSSKSIPLWKVMLLVILHDKA